MPHKNESYNDSYILCMKCQDEGMHYSLVNLSDNWAFNVWTVNFINSTTINTKINSHSLGEHFQLPLDVSVCR